MATVNKKLKFVILQQVILYHYYYFKSIAIENYQYSRMRNLHMNLQMFVNIL